MVRDPIITAEPLDDGRYRFGVTEPVHDLASGSYRFESRAAAAGVPVAEAVLAVPGIGEVVLGRDAVTVGKDSAFEWCDLEEQVRYAIQTGVAELQASAGAVPVSGAPDMDDDAMYDVVAEVFRSEINPTVARHGGEVELIDVQDATVVLRMSGGCQGCGMANVTLRQGIEGSLKRILPTLKGIEDITDHSAGTDPYFTSEKK